MEQKATRNFDNKEYGSFLFVHLFKFTLLLFTEFMFLKLFPLILFPIKDFLSSSRCKMTGKFSVFIYVSMSILKFFSILHLFSCFIHSIQIMCYFKMKVFFNKVEDRKNKKVKLFWTYCTTNFNFENFYVFLFCSYKIHKL